MTALPSNLALVGDDLARATFIDARRSHRRRRLATCAVAFALFALFASAAVANGWLFGDGTPVIRAVPSLSGTSSPGSVPASAVAAAADLAQSEEAASGRQRASPGCRRHWGARMATTPRRSSWARPRASLADRRHDDERWRLHRADRRAGSQCVPTFDPGQDLIPFTSSPSATETVVWGVVTR